MKCPNCNETKHEAGAKFCHVCGTELVENDHEPDLVKESPKYPIDETHESIETPKNVPASKREFTINGVSFNMIYVEGGTFWKGAQSNNPSERNFDVDADYYEEPVRQVSLDSFYIGETQVTQGLWSSFGWDTFSKYFPQNTGGTKPVFNVSYQWKAREFCSLLSAVTGEMFRLPSDDEWEYAARGGNMSKGFRFAGSNVINEVCWSAINSDKVLHPVKILKPNELGIYDMNGNVWEWCSDPSRIDGLEKNGITIRGGSYKDLPRDCRVSSIDGAENGDSIEYRLEGNPILHKPIGFRLVMIPNNAI